MKKYAPLCILLCILLLAQYMAVPAYGTAPADAETQPVEETVSSAVSTTDRSVLSGCHTIDGQIPLLGTGKLLDRTKAAFLFEVNSDTVIYAWNPDTRVHPASLVKIMTCLIAVEQGNMSDVVTASSNALKSVPEYMTGEIIRTGEEMTMEQLMHMMMVGSSNHAAAVIAEHISGSQNAFVAEMNKRAKLLGCKDTNFVNAHGLQDENQYTTARDLARILREAMKNELFMEFFAAIEFDIPPTNKTDGTRYLRTTNYLMKQGSDEIWYDKRVTGGRTGVTDARERSIACTAVSGEMDLVSIILCADPIFYEDDFSVKYFGNYEETTDMLNLGCNNKQITQVLHEGEITGQYEVPGGASNLAVGPSSSVSTILPSNIKPSELTIRTDALYSSLDAPIEAGQVLTKVQVWYGSVCLAEADLVAKNSVQKLTVQNSGTASGDSGSFLDTLVKVILLLAGVIVIAAGGLFIVRYLRTARYRKQSRRRSKARRRSR